MPNHHFPKQRRLLRPSEFQRVFDARSAAADGVMRLFGAASDVGHARLGLAVSRKVGGAVVRNRWKRTVREAFRLVQHDLPPLDLVCVPRPDAVPNVRQLTATLTKLARRIERKVKG